MKNIFNWTRFTMVLRNDAAGLRMPFLIAALILCGIWLQAFWVAKIMVKEFGQFDYFRANLAVAFVIGSMALAPLILYAKHNHKLKGIHYFMLPASQLEKFCSMLFYCIVVTPLVALLTFGVFDLCLYPVYPWDGATVWFGNPRFGDTGFVLGMILWALALQSLFLLCNTWFRRAKIGRTALVVGIVIGAYSTFQSLLALLFPLSMDAAMQTVLIDAPAAYDATLEQSLWITVKPYLPFLIAPTGLWVASFMKMKEQEL